MVIKIHPFIIFVKGIYCAKGYKYNAPTTRKDENILRHGHTVYALKRASNVAQLKAVSQNIMHRSLVTTDQTYGKLINDDVQDIIAKL